MTDQNETASRYDDAPRWCCMCGKVNPPNLEICAVSEHLMVTKARYPAKKGLTHLLAYSVHPKAVAIFESHADDRAELRQGYSRANLTNIRARMRQETSRAA